MQKDEVLDFDGAVEYLKTTPSTLYKWLQAGKIPASKLGRQWRFSKSQLEAYLIGNDTGAETLKDIKKLVSKLKERNNLIKEDQMNLINQNVAEQIIWDAYGHGARIVHFSPSRGGYDVSYRKRTGLEVFEHIQIETFENLHGSLISMSQKSSESESRRIYLHRENIKAEIESLQVMYQKIDTIAGEKITLQIWQPETDVMPIENISSGDPSVLEQFKKWTQTNNGLFVVSGAAGSGKTTTSYALLNELKKRGLNVFTLEEKVHVIIEGLNQVEFKNQKQLKFDETVDKIMASDPDVIWFALTGFYELEEQMIKAAFRAASSGHIVIIQLDLESVEEVKSLLGKCISRPSEKVLKGIVIQKLILKDGKQKAVYSFA